MKFAIDTLGCKLNQAETEELVRQLIGAGHQLVLRAEDADIYIVNTCTVTNTADAKSRHLLRMAHRRNPRALVVAAGCYAETASDKLGQTGGGGLVVGKDEKAHLLKILEDGGYLGQSSAQIEEASSHRPGLRTRSFVKIQDGCNKFCSYCIVPLVRGREKSMSVRVVLDEINQRVADGYKEIVLTGTNIGTYKDNGANLKALLESILAGTGVARLRLSSLQPQEVSPELIELWQDSRLCPHFHMSLQSGSDTVLQRMKRRYSVSDYQRTVSLIRSRIPDAGITADIIVGFPGETDAEFAESYEVCCRLEFARIHVFAFSPRLGTKAALLKPVEDGVKKQRSQQMLALARESASRFRRRFAGQAMPVLWESRSASGVWAGFTGNYIRVTTRSDSDLTNQLLPARIA